MAVAVEIAELWVTRPGDQVIDVLGVSPHAGPIAASLRSRQQLGVTQQFVGLVVQTDRVTLLDGQPRTVDEQLLDSSQALLRQCSRVGDEGRRRGSGLY